MRVFDINKITYIIKQTVNVTDSPKILVSSCYIGTTGFNNHSRDFFRNLSKHYPLKIRNFTVPKYWNGIIDEPFNKEPYITDLDKKLYNQQTSFEPDKTLYDYRSL